jgi:hypothetical protein
MRRLAAFAALASAIVTALLVRSASPQQAGADGPPQYDSVIDDYTTGRCECVVESSLIHQPQIERVPDFPRQRVIPIHKLPIPEGQRPEDRGFSPRPRCYAGFSGVNDTGWFPPDPTLAVGPNHVVELVNATISWYDKATGAVQFSAPLDSSGNPGFFEGVGAGSFCFDTRAVYDDIDNRFVVVCAEVYSNTAWIDIAVSDDNDPNGTWYKYRTDALTTVGLNTYWVDYPSLGFDDVGYYVTGNLFEFTSGASGGTKYRCFDKSTMLSGGTATWKDLRDSGSFSVQAGEHHTIPNAPFFMSLSSSTRIKLQAIKTPVTNPQLVTTTLTVASFSSPPDAPNLGGSGLDTLDGRIINLDHRDDRLVCGHGVDAGAGKATARWYDVKARAWPQSGSPLLNQTGNLDLGNDTCSWYPALAWNGNDEIGMSFAFSGSHEYAGIGYATQKTTDPAGVMSQVVRVKQGMASYNNTRWGDFFDCCPDPSDATKFWGVGEYTLSTNSWGTWIHDFDSTWDPPTSDLLLSLRGDKSTGGFYFLRGDIVHYDKTSKLYDMYFDLSDVLAPAGTGNIDAFALLSDGSIAMSFVTQLKIAGMTGGPNGTVLENSDMVRFVPTTLGEATTGSWVFWFDGSDVGLDTLDENIDAVAVDGSGNPIISVTGPFDFGGGFIGKDEDLVLFTPTSLGATTAGTWSMFLNGRDSDVRLGTNGEDTDAVDFDATTVDITISTTGDFQVPVNITGHKDDLITFTATTLGTNPSGSWAFTFDGSANGLDDVNDDIDGLEILP